MKTFFKYLIWLRIKLLFLVNKRWGAKAALKLFSTPFNQKVRDRELPYLKENYASQESIDNRSIEYYQYGKGEESILLLHGWQGNAGSMGAFVDQLIKIGVSVISVNAPAHHNSEGRTCSIPDYSKVIEHFINHYKPIGIVAHSFACAAVAYALPKAIHKVQTLVLIGTPNRMERIAEKFLNLFDLKKAERNAFVMELEKLTELDLEIARLDKMLLSTQAKTLLIHDKGDKIAPFSNAVEIEKSIPNIQLMATTGNGHYRILWDHKVVDQTVKFIYKESILSKSK